MKKGIFSVIVILTNTTSFAGTDWYIKFINNSNVNYSVVARQDSTQNCWYYKDSETPKTISAQAKTTLYTEVDNAFIVCKNTNHQMVFDITPIDSSVPSKSFYFSMLTTSEDSSTCPKYIA